jgi:hypothetical protein
MKTTTEIIRSTGAFFFVSPLDVGLKPHNPKGGELPIVANLTTTHESAWV